MLDRRVFVTRGEDYTSQRDSLERYIDQLPSSSDFDLQNWLSTLESGQLKRMEVDATKYCCCSDLSHSLKISGDSLIAIAAMAYCAEGCLDGEVQESAAFTEKLLIGLAVAVCIERLRRTGWVVLTGRMMISMRDPRPYQVTQRGLTDGVWSDDPFTLWVLGSQIQLH
jgi:hypothetical protein